MSFANWLIRQHERTDWVGQLARYARKDRLLPAAPLDIWERVQATSGGDAEMLHALTAALAEWNGGPYRLDHDRAARREREREAENAAYEAELRAEEDAARRARNAAARARRAGP